MNEKRDFEDKMLLVFDYIECHAEHSRWSTSFTLLISITVASIIALLGSFVELNDINSFFHNKEQDRYILHFDSVNKIKIIPIATYNPKDSVSKSKIMIALSDTSQIQTLQMNINSSMASGSNIISIDSIRIDSVKIYSDPYIISKPDTTLIDFVKGDSIKFISIAPDTLTYNFTNADFNYTIKKGDKKSDLTASQILFSCITFLGLIFTLFFYILRYNAEKEIIKIKKKISINKKLTYNTLKKETNDFIDFLNDLDYETYKDSINYINAFKIKLNEDDVNGKDILDLIQKYKSKIIKIREIRGNKYILEELESTEKESISKINNALNNIRK